MKYEVALLNFSEISIRRPGTCAALMLAVFLIWTAPAAADEGQGSRTRVSGDSVYSDCGTFATELSGDLNGCLDIVPQRFTCEEQNGFAVYREWGEEFFRDEDGESMFHTTYDLEGIYAEGFCTTFDFTTQLSGGCDHKVFNGNGKYRGSNGLIVFYDIIPEPGVSGASNFLYHGNVKYRD